MGEKSSSTELQFHEVASGGSLLKKRIRSTPHLNAQKLEHNLFRPIVQSIGYRPCKEKLQFLSIGEWYGGVHQGMLSGMNSKYPAIITRHKGLAVPKLDVVPVWGCGTP